MELNTRGRYAVMAMADIAKHGGEGSVPLSAVAERQHLSVDYLEQIFLKLRRAGLVESTRGRLGGYRIARPAVEIYVAEIMSAVDEETRMTRCLSGEGQGCVDGQRCIAHSLWHALGEHIESFLNRVSLQHVLDNAVVPGPSPTPEQAPDTCTATHPV